MVRESHEEAGLDADLIKQHAKAVGTIGYVTASETKTTSGGEAGLIRAEIQYIYHLKVGPDVVITQAIRYGSLSTFLGRPNESSWDKSKTKEGKPHPNSSL
jgi:hypothetical protein